MLSCLKGRVFILSGLLCLGFIGCGIPNRGMKTVQAPIPPSNIQVEEKVIELALKDLGIPGGGGIEVLCVVGGENKASDMVRIIAPEILLRHGYRIVEKKVSVPELRFTVDTLHVTLTSEKSRQTGKITRRFAEARIGVVFLETNGTRHVYRGRGTFDDSFASYMLHSMECNDPYVIDFVSVDWLTSKFKPVVIGVTMTVLLWMLYSYRG